jgi:hypothetical protein
LPSACRLLILAPILCATALAQSSDAVGEFWPTLYVHSQIKDAWRMVAAVGSEKGADYPYQQIFSGGGFGYMMKSFDQPHRINADAAKEHRLLVGVGYEYLRTIESAEIKNENRLIIATTPRHRFGPKWLMSDRNRVEVRWVNGSRSTRYRNALSLERDVRIRSFLFVPYGSAEVFYDFSKSSWNQQRFSGGLQWPYKQLLMLETYYLYQHVAGGNPARVNVAGLTLHLYFRNGM